MSEQLYVARQPIFDADATVHAYELLFRSGPENFFQAMDPDVASTRVIGDAFHVFGLNNLAQDKKLFINCTKKILLEDYLLLLPPEVTVVEILETVEPDNEVVAACQRLKDAGYTLALDDFVMAPGLEKLVALADIIKVDFRLTRGDERRKVVGSHRRTGLRFLAEKVETQADVEEGIRFGYELFQGYFFCRPEMVSARDVPGTKWVMLRLLKALSASELDFDALEGILKQDVALTVKLLRYLSSAAFGWKSQVTSIKQALVLLGEVPFRKWASLVTMTALGADKPRELLTTCLFRARLCERLAETMRMKGHELDLFFVGLLSSVDVLVGRPMADVLESLSVAPVVKETLLGQPTDLSKVFGAVLAYERARFDEAASLLPDATAQRALPRLYTEALQWAAEMNST